MPGDPTSNDDELLSQIDELKARMDRLMRGGTSTSNSALLTDTVKQPEPPSVETPAETAATERTRVRDLIAAEDTEVIEVYPGPKEVVQFPDGKKGPEPKVEAPAAAASVEPEPSKPVGGSLISVPEDTKETRTPVASFDQLGDAIQQELARDASVPPPGSNKGPDLASRFGSANDRVEADAAPEIELDEPEELVSDEPVAEESEAAPEADLEELDFEPEVRSSGGLVAAIWALAAIASGAIATLHFTGVI